MSSAQISLSRGRSYGSVTDTAIADCILTTSVLATQNGGMYLYPFRIPTCLDVARPVNLDFYASHFTIAGSDAGDILFRLRTSTVLDGQTAVTVDTDFLWTPTLPWPAGEVRRLRFPGPVTDTWESGYFNQSQVVGLRLSRQGSDPLDTFGKAMETNYTLELTYMSRCFDCCSL